MQVVRGLHNLQAAHRGCVLTIGNFDGLHLGHQAVIETLCERAKQLNLPSVLMTFEPTPREFFCPDEAPPRLSRLRETLEDAAQLGLDRLLIVRFDKSFSTLSPQAFVRELLVERLGVRLVIVGEDFRFGAEREGSLELLRQAGRAHGFEVAPMPTVTIDGQRVSSTRVRAALAAGQVQTARQLLGRAYRVSGRVVAGQRLGRTLGMPTANLRMLRKPAPRFGVYAVDVVLEDDSRWPAAASLGTRPTVSGEGCLLESYLLDFDADLYGRQIDVLFHTFLRDEERFDDLDTLRRQMQQDVQDVRAYFAGSLSI